MQLRSFYSSMSQTYRFPAHLQTTKNITYNFHSHKGSCLNLLAICSLPLQHMELPFHVPIPQTVSESSNLPKTCDDMWWLCIPASCLTAISASLLLAYSSFFFWAAIIKNNFSKNNGLWCSSGAQECPRPVEKPQNKYVSTHHWPTSSCNLLILWLRFGMWFIIYTRL